MGNHWRRWADENDRRLSLEYVPSPAGNICKQDQRRGGFGDLDRRTVFRQPDESGRYGVPESWAPHQTHRLVPMILVCWQLSILSFLMLNNYKLNNIRKGLELFTLGIKLRRGAGLMDSLISGFISDTKGNLEFEMFSLRYLG